MDVWYIHERQNDKQRIEKARCELSCLSQLSLEVVTDVLTLMSDDSE